MKQLKEQNVLFFTRTMGLGGTENVILQLCEILKPEVNNIVVCSCGGVNVEKLDTLGIRHYLIGDISDKSPKTIVKNIFALNKIVFKENITVIHCHHRMAAFYVSLLRLYKNCTFISTCHNTFQDKKKMTFFSYKHCNLIACGEKVKRNLIEFFGLFDKQVTVIHNAVKPFNGNVIDDPLIKRFHDMGYFVIGNIGRLSEQKGLEYFIKSIPYVIKENRNTKFVIAGSGEDEKKLIALSEKLGVSANLIFLGYRNDVQNLMSQLDLIVLSSLWEGLPLTPIEAFSVEKTIVATAVDGTPEIVKNKYNGFLIEPKNPIQMAEKINWMIENKEKRREMEINARKTYENEFSFNVFSNVILDYYRSL